MTADSVAEVTGEPREREHRHPRGTVGRLDESARRLSHQELAVAQLLVDEGHDVRSLAEGRQLGRTADLDVCGVPTEVKSLQIGATSWTLENQLHRAVGQGRHVVVDGRSSGLKRRWAERGVERFAGRGDWRGSIVAVRVIGEGYDLAYGARELSRLCAFYRHAPRQTRGLAW
jgi:hypothetical protein